MNSDFKKMMADAGLPVDETIAKAQWDAELKTQEITIENNSPFSPFWRTVKALITKPVVALLDWVAKQVMPDLFIMTASRDALVNLHGPSRNVFIYDAVKATGTLRLARVDTAGVVSIAAGTVIESDNIAGKVYQLIMLQTAVFNDTEASIDVLAEAVETGQAFNLPGTSYNNFETPIAGISVTNPDDWLITPGADSEDTESYRNRIRNVFGTAGRWHSNSVYKQIISDFWIPIDNIVIINQAPRGPGTADAYIYLNVGNVSGALLTAINQHIRDDGHHGHGDEFMVYAMPVQPVDVTATYWLHPGSNDIAGEIDNFIRAAFRQNDGYQPTRPIPNSTFSISLLKSELHNQFAQLKSITFDIADIQCGLWLPQLNNLVVQHG